jgi:hypothetical protein
MHINVQDKLMRGCQLDALMEGSGEAGGGMGMDELRTLD